MAEQFLGEGSSGTASGESSDANLVLNVKTLDSRLFHFKVDKNIQVSAFKEKIAGEIGVSVGQQRLIFRGKVLKDEYLLSQYHVENDDTLHLVERQPTQASSGSGSSETTVIDANPGGPRGRIGQISHSVVLGTFNVGEQGEWVVPDITRVIGTVLSSIGLGNMGQVNVGANGLTPVMLNNPSQGSQGNTMGVSQGNHGGQTHTGNQPSSGQAIPNVPFQSLPQVVQVPIAAAAIPVPTVSAPIPDSLNTLLECMNWMDQIIASDQQNTSSTSTRELPPSARGLPTPEALGIVLRHAERLLSSQAVAALSHIAGRLERQGTCSDSTIRGQIQAETSQTGIAMQHLGALFLELGRTMLTLRMGQSPGEAFVNAGPAVYISPQGPNPIMVQPIPLQTNSLFGGLVPPVNPVSFGPVGVGHTPRSININIHAGTSLSPIASVVGGRLSTGDGGRSERGDSNSFRDPGTAPPLRTVNTTVPATPSSLPGSTAAESVPVSGVQSQTEIQDQLSSLIALVNSQIRSLVDNIEEGNQDPSVASVGNLAVSGGQSHSEIVDPLSSTAAQTNSQIRNLDSNIQEGNGAPSGQTAISVVYPSVGTTSAPDQPNVVAVDASSQPTHSSTEHTHEPADKADNSQATTQDSRELETARNVSSGDALSSVKSEGASSSSSSHDTREGTNSTPLGLGLGGLEPKKRPKQPKPQPEGSDGELCSTEPERRIAQSSGQQLLQSLLSRGTAERTNAASPVRTGFPAGLGQATNSNSSRGGQVSDSQIDMAGMMSQVLQNPALNGLLSGVSEQAGVGSPDALRNMLQQFTQSPAVMNMVSRIAEQVDPRDLGGMFSGMGGGQGGEGRMDLSGMLQQMMPIVSQAFGGGPPGGGSFPPVAGRENDKQLSDRVDQEELGSVARQVERLNPPRDIFRAMAESAVQSSAPGTGSQDLLDALCSDEELINEYENTLGRDLQRRLQGDCGNQK